GNNEEDQVLRISKEERIHEEEDADELYRDVDINQGRGLQLSQDIEDSHVILTPINPDGQQESSSVSSQFVTSMLNPTSDAGMESIFATALSPVAPLQTSTPIVTPSTIATITTIIHAPIPPTPIPSEVLQNLPTFDLVFRFDERLKSLEASFSEYRQTNPFAEAVSNISVIVHQYMNQQMNEAVRVVVQIQTDRLRDSYQRENDEFLRTIDDNMKRIIKEQVKGRVKEQVSKILPRIEQSVNAQLEAEVLTRSSHSSRTSSAVAADLSEMELKKILIEKMEGNKSIQRSDEQRNLYKALVEAYKADKIILDTYGERVILKRRRDDDDDDDDQGEGPSAGSDRGSKRQREGKESKSASALLQTTTRSAGRSTSGSKSRQASASESAFAEEPIQTTSQIKEPSHLVFETGVEDQPIVQSSQHPEWFSQPKKPPTLNRDWNKTLPAAQGSTQSWISDLAKQANSHSSFNKLLDTPLDFSNFIMNRLRPLPLIPVNRGHRVIPFVHFINNDLEYLRGGAFRRKCTTSVTKTKVADYKNIKWIEDLVPRSMWIQEPINHEKHALWGVSHWGWKRKLSNLTVEERFAFNVSLWMFTRSIVIQRRAEYLQLGVESYQKTLNLTKPDTYRCDLKRRDADTAYSNPKGFIYQNKDKKNRLMRIDELHKFSDGMLNDVRNALDDRLKGIRMQCLPQTIWRKGDKDRAAAMIQAIDKMLKTRRIMKSLKRFVGGRLYEGDVRMLQRTI
nr:hypothetical protein [Tanacetum cinerariifolium]